MLWNQYQNSIFLIFHYKRFSANTILYLMLFKCKNSATIIAFYMFVYTFEWRSFSFNSWIDSAIVIHHCYQLILMRLSYQIYHHLNEIKLRHRRNSSVYIWFLFLFIWIWISRVNIMNASKHIDPWSYSISCYCWLNWLSFYH